jgi:hypothetical protein
VSRRRALAATLLLLAGTLAGCGGRTLPVADDRLRPAPDLTGQRVMVLPAQPGAWSGVPVAGAALDPAELDAELGFWLTDGAPRVQWVLPPELARALARSPGLGIDLGSLAVGSFRRAEVRRIGDPLFGDLRRLSALVDARHALVPVAAAFVEVAGGEGAQATGAPPAAAQGRVEVAAALVDTFTGLVLWFGVVGGEPGRLADGAVIATAARALARAMAP